jgi:hypothetical protein
MLQSANQLVICYIQRASLYTLRLQNSYECKDKAYDTIEHVIN